MKTISERIKSRYYKHRHVFISDMLRMFHNCRVYNETESTIYKNSLILEKFFISKMQESNLL